METLRAADGFLFRGRHFIQVTGRANYCGAGNDLWKHLRRHRLSYFVANPDQVASFPHSVRSAVCFWVQHGLPALADHGSSDLNVDAITAVINKDTPSYGDRRNNFQQAIQVFQ